MAELTSSLFSLVFGICVVVVQAIVVVVHFKVEGAPVVRASTTLGKGAVHAIAGPRAIPGECADRLRTFCACHDGKKDNEMVG